MKLIIEKLIYHHDVLRMRYEKSSDGNWKQINGGKGENYYVFEEAFLPSESKGDELSKQQFFNSSGTVLKRTTFIVGLDISSDENLLDDPE